MREIKKPNLTNKEILSEDKGIHITLLIDTDLNVKIKNILRAKWAEGDFKYTSFSQVLRVALQDYKDGKLKMIKYDGVGKKQISARFPKDLMDFYNTIPNGKRSFIINSLLNTYLKKLTK